MDRYHSIVWPMVGYHWKTIESNGCQTKNHCKTIEPNGCQTKKPSGPMADRPKTIEKNWYQWFLPNHSFNGNDDPENHWCFLMVANTVQKLLPWEIKQTNHHINKNISNFFLPLDPTQLHLPFGSPFLLEKVPISLKNGSPFWQI